MVETPAPEIVCDWREDGTVLLTLNRPHARNTVSFTMWEQFSAALDRLENETPARALVLCGAGGYFSSGGDVKIGPTRGEGAIRLAARLEMGQRIINRLRALPMPTIAAVEGGAFGIAWSIAMACDMLFAADNAKFGAPFLDFGLVPDGGAAWFLVQRLGRARAAEIMFSGRTLEVDEARDLGLLSRVLPAGRVVEEALAFGARIGAGNPHAVELTKRLLHMGETSDLAATQALELIYCHTCQAGEEVPRAREAFAARAAARKAAKGG
jgi:enoyl-CoA hydratase/carnithine racemase